MAEALVRALGGEVPAIEPEGPVCLRVQLFDVTLTDGRARVRAFITLHGTDPDEDGKDAMTGSIRFEPISA